MQRLIFAALSTIALLNFLASDSLALNDRFSDSREAAMNKLNQRFEGSREAVMNKLNQRFDQEHQETMNK